jgi:HD domain
MAIGMQLAWPVERFIRSRTQYDFHPVRFAFALVLVPLSFLPLNALNHVAPLEVPYHHFYIVSTVSLLAALVAAILAVTTIQIGQYRVLFICLGFLSMCAIFTVHGLTTPGILLPPSLNPYAYRAVGASAYFSLLAPGLFFAATYAPGMRVLERRLPFWPAGWLVVLTVNGLIAYGALAILSTESLAESALTNRALMPIFNVVSIGLFLFAAARQAQVYRLVRLPSQANLIVAYLLLADAAAAMNFPLWTWGWWYYHVLMLAAVCFAVRALVAERTQGKTFRSTVEAVLELEVDVETEEIDVDAVAALVAAVEVKDRETQGHNHRVAELCVKIGHEMGMQAGDLRVLARSGLLHDVGKLGIPDAILHKPGPLDDWEWSIMKTHPELGLEIVKRTGQFDRELLGVLHHHERMDGSGYPRGLAGDEIPLEARIVAVADTYDVLTSDRPYRKARMASEAISIVQQEAGTHLDRNVVSALLKTLDSGIDAPLPLTGRHSRGSQRFLAGLVAIHR